MADREESNKRQHDDDGDNEDRVLLTSLSSPLHAFTKAGYPRAASQVTS